MLRPGAAVGAVVPEGAYASQPFFTGFLEGYNTMDALASLAFGIVVVQVIRDLGVTGAGRRGGQHRPRGYLQLPAHGRHLSSPSPSSACRAAACSRPAENGGIALAQIAQHYLG